MKKRFKQPFIDMKNTSRCVMESKQWDIFRAGPVGDIVYAWQTPPTKTGFTFFFFFFITSFAFQGIALKATKYSYIHNAIKFQDLMHLSWQR